MAKSETKESCFIIMPITTPKHLVERYKEDADHFTHVLEHLFIPALENAGFEPVSPKSTGSDVIQAEIIKQLSSCELVLCDMSILNPNVFFEFGIRTALNKPVALVVDNKTEPIPFDTSVLNFHTYDSSVELWSIEKEKQALTKHIHEAYKKSKYHNALWKYFGVAQTGTFKPEEAEMGDKLDLIIQKLSAIKMEQDEKKLNDLISDLSHSTISPPYIEKSSSSVSQSKSSKQALEDSMQHFQKYLDQYKAMQKRIKEPEKDKSQEPD